MSIVTGIIVICDLGGERPSAREDWPALFGELDAWLIGKGFAPLKQFDNELAGTKHPQFYAAGAGFNMFPEDDFAACFVALPWQAPENAILIIQPEDGETRIVRPVAERSPIVDPHLGEISAVAQPFQHRVALWMLACFGEEISKDTAERNHRFLEESLELVQACGCTASEAHQLVDYVFGRPVGEPRQEVGGVQVTLAALCLAQGMDMHAAGETELERIWGKIEQIRDKQAAKPRHSPLPEFVEHNDHLYRHRARGTIYQVIGSAELQAATGAPEEGAILTVYRSEDGKVWARRASEFGDGRFERIP